MRRSLFLTALLATLVACDPSGRVVFESFEPNEEFVLTQPAGDRAYWVRGTEVWAIDPRATNRGAELVAGGFTSPSKFSLLVDDDYVFLWDAGDILRTRRDGSERTELQLGCIGFKLSDDGTEFVCEKYNPDTKALSLIRVSKQTGEVLLEVPIEEAGSVATSPTHLYVVGADALLAIDKSSGSVATVAPLAENSTVLGLEYLRGRLYWIQGVIPSDRSTLHSYDPSSGWVEALGEFEHGGGLAARGDTLYFRHGPSRISAYDVVTGKTEEIAYVPRLYHFAVTDTHVVAATDGRLIGFER